MKNIYKRCMQLCKSFPLLSMLGALLAVNSVLAQSVATIDDLTLAPNSSWNGSDLSGGFQSGDVYFYNSYNTQYKSWSGFAYTNKKDTVTPKSANPYSAITGSGFNGSANYVVSYVYSPSTISLKGSLKGKTVSGFYVTNTTNTALSMKSAANGEFGAKQFGGETGEDPDWFKLTVKGFLNNAAKSASVDFYLADFRSDYSATDYIVDTWQWVDLTSLGDVDSLTFELSSSDVGEWGMNTPAYFAMDNFNNPQFAPTVGIDGANGVNKDDLVFKAWATGGSIQRGYQNIANPALGLAGSGELTGAFGKAGSGAVSLGDSGYATLTFDLPIINGVGNDFAVFEYSFGQEFKELAFVEVSSDGAHFFRFPAVSNTDPYTRQVGPFATMQTTVLYNLAGKYNGNYGTPFDLEELKDVDGLNINNVTHVRIVDVVGSINDLYASVDSEGKKVNDPWPTPFASSGFDLDAVGIINSGVPSGLAYSDQDNGLSLFPNPSQKDQVVNVHVDRMSGNEISVQVYDFAGRLVSEKTVNTEHTTISTEGMQAGIYTIKVLEEGSSKVQKLVIN